MIRIYTFSELLSIVILEKHQKWLKNEEGGECANLGGADLKDANLRDANLKDADLSCVDLRNANL